MSNLTFTPQSDDKFVGAVEFVEVANVKPSGYLNHRGVVPVESLPKVVESLNEYYAASGRPEPVTYTRKPGSVEWVAYGVTEGTIPDELPTDFK